MPLGILIVNDTFELDLTHYAVFRPRCDGEGSGIFHSESSDSSTVTDLRPPFYASTAPQIFAIAAATVISYVLVVLIFITPRTFYVGGPGGGAGFLTRRGLGGNPSVIGVGRRPLLQKIAAFTVALSLTMATADTFIVAQKQYTEGFINSDEMMRDVVGAIEIRVVQVISDTFLWLAQVQTLIRLYPRHKEKVTIKWLGFALVLLDAIFSCLNNFLMFDRETWPGPSPDAIPALSYLFELAIGFIYASCVIYYSISKYRFAFYHAKMRNICLVALISIISVLIPVVFFVIDLASPDIATWGFYVHWVGAIAASVVVWEWVERIEALERDETKDGILGREIYDGDDMLDLHIGDDHDRVDEKSDRHKGDKTRYRSTSTIMKWVPGNYGRPRRSLHLPVPSFPRRQKRHEISRQTHPVTLGLKTCIPRPPAFITPPPEGHDTASTVSTVYTVRYHRAEPMPPSSSDEPTSRDAQTMAQARTSSTSSPLHAAVATHGSSQQKLKHPTWTALIEPFKRKRASLPAEVAGAQLLKENSHPLSGDEVTSPNSNYYRNRLFSRLISRSSMRSSHRSHATEDPLPVTVIPTRTNGGQAWSPVDGFDGLDAASPNNSAETCSQNNKAADATNSGSPLPSKPQHDVNIPQECVSPCTQYAASGPDLGEGQAAVSNNAEVLEACRHLPGFCVSRVDAATRTVEQSCHADASGGLVRPIRQLCSPAEPRHRHARSWRSQYGNHTLVSPAVETPKRVQSTRTENRASGSHVSGSEHQKNTMRHRRSSI